MNSFHCSLSSVILLSFHCIHDEVVYLVVQAQIDDKFIIRYLQRLRFLVSFFQTLHIESVEVIFSIVHLSDVFLDQFGCH